MACVCIRGGRSRLLRSGKLRGRAGVGRGGLISPRPGSCKWPSRALCRALAQSPAPAPPPSSLCSCVLHPTPPPAELARHLCLAAAAGRTPAMPPMCPRPTVLLPTALFGGCRGGSCDQAWTWARHLLVRRRRLAFSLWDRGGCKGGHTGVPACNGLWRTVVCGRARPAGPFGMADASRWFCGQESWCLWRAHHQKPPCRHMYGLCIPCLCAGRPRSRRTTVCVSRRSLLFPWPPAWPRP